MKERDVRIARNRLCSAAMAADGTYYPSACQKCKSPCRYGTDLLHHYGMMRLAPKETPSMKADVLGSERIRRTVRGLNKYSIARR